jgi:hypothetical protein
VESIGIIRAILHKSRGYQMYLDDSIFNREP